MKSRLVTAGALVLAALTMSGCLAQPEPEPSPAFASEEEAFAAAEETYRAYVDALNRVDLSDPATFEEVYAWTTGDANAGERKSLTSMRADGWSVSGATKVVSMGIVSFDPVVEPNVTITVCTDVSDVQVIDRDGASQVSGQRPPVQSALVHLTSAISSGTGLLIAQIEGSDAPC